MSNNVAVLSSYSEKFYIVSPDFGKNWYKRAYKINWDKYFKKGLRWTPFLRIIFTTPKIGYALASIWIESEKVKPRFDNIAVLKSDDGGIHWCVLNILKLDHTIPNNISSDGVLNFENLIDLDAQECMEHVTGYKNYLKEIAM